MAIMFTGSNRKSKKAVVSDINVTPLVDVMLVLLIIFMVTSPMLVSGVNVDLPETNPSTILEQDEPLVITINNEGKIFLLETLIERTHLTDKIINITTGNKNARIFVRGDKNVSYGKVVEVIAEIHSAGFSRVALISNIKNNEK
ncbi:protein TolR [Rickettsia prowazekii]|uniref:TolR n=1 Tax=Rickettsia prowazekii (strain Rp22) TaxID=449216 RepID=D5AWN7_RICPP|nr:protein TolR [Rickettsia prowazekii]EOB09667.1 TolQ [Rickettsia prowazekii str. GvF12]ADE29826.1 TolR [Rickettsia prowazekii str. Rp22]AFE49127.1 TOLR protein (tolR) [Rickettsia prowazekii str. Chernikova]AFE50817.1 TOLR protein (tolR) [Rickettsia prowazekii str. BuV67-CWPP]AFE51656.1 TOLR protein (tolR) [Rickettsia prowazekii str. Dachau]